MAGAIGAIGGALGSAGSAIGSALGGASAGPIVGGLGSAASLLSGGGGDSGTSTTSVDPLTQARYQDLYNRGLDVYNTPFTPYTGERIAGFTPDQLEAQGQVKSMLDQSLRFDPRNQLNKLAGQGPESVNVKSLLDGDIGAYQNPFTEQVIDNTLDDLNDARLMQLQKDQDAAIGRGAFGGSRSAILESESQRPFVEAMARTAAEQRERGFGQALRSAEADVARQQQMAMFAPELDLRARQQQAGLLGGLQGQQFQTLGLLGGMGAQQRGLQQQAIDAQRAEFFRALGYGPQQIGLLQGGMGTPLVSQTQTQSQKAGLGGILGGAAGLLGSMALGGAFGAGGMFGGAGAGAGALPPGSPTFLGY